MELLSVQINPLSKTIDVAWDNGFRRAYSGVDRDLFLIEVTDGQIAAEECWPNWKIEDYEPTVNPLTVIIPQVISRFQGRIWLLRNGLLDTVKGMMAQADAETQMAWDETVEWRRDSPTIALMAQGLNKTTAEIDQMFVESAVIVA